MIPVDLTQYPSNEQIAATLLRNVPKGVHNVLVDFITRLYAVYVDCQFTYVTPPFPSLLSPPLIYSIATLRSTLS